MKDNQITWTSFFDGGGTDGPISTRWHVTGWPTLFILDKKGVIRATGGKARSQMEQVVEELLAER